MNGVHDVTDFGADPTGATDSSDAFQAALDDLPDVGGTVYVPPGRYRVVSTIVWPAVGDTSTLKPARIRGENPSVIKGVPGAWSRGASAIFFAGEGALFDLRAGGGEATNFSGGFDRLALHGPGREGTVGIDAYNVRVAQFDDLVVRNFGTNVRVEGESYYSVWEDCLFSDAVTDGAQFSNDMNGSGFTRCRFAANGRHGLRLRDGGFPVGLDRCWMEANGGFALHSENTIQVSMTGSYIERNEEGSIRIVGYPGSVYRSGIAVVDSYFRPREGRSVLSVDAQPVTIRLLDNTVDSTLGAASVLALPSGGRHSVVAIGSVCTGQGGRVPLLAGDPSSLECIVAFGDDSAAQDEELGSANVLRGVHPLTIHDSPVEFPAMTTGERPSPGRAGRVFFNSDQGTLNIDTGERWVRPDGRDA